MSHTKDLPNNRTAPVELHQANAGRKLYPNIMETSPELTEEIIAWRKQESAELTSGTKYDSGKPQLSLIPTTALNAEAAALAYGKGKYGLHNYKGGFEYSRLIDACLRHVLAFKEGEDKDVESGASHLGHARACLAMLIDQIERGKGTDNRFKEPG